MSFEGFTPKQEKTAEEMLKGSALKDVGFADEGFAKESKTVMEAVGGSMDSNPFTKIGSKDYQEDEEGRPIVDDETSNAAAKWIDEKGSEEAKKLELL